MFPSPLFFYFAVLCSGSRFIVQAGCHLRIITGLKKYNENTIRHSTFRKASYWKLLWHDENDDFPHGKLGTLRFYR